MNSKLTSLTEFIAQQRYENFPVNELGSIMHSITEAAVAVNHQVNRAGLADILGAEDSENISGETQQKLDIIANDLFIDGFKTGGLVCGLASEENDDFVAFESAKGQYLVMIDPLDGSSNIDVNVSIGTIFGISKRPSGPETVSIQDFFQKGSEQLAAGYVLYGSSTMLVFTTGHGVNGFTLDPTDNKFYLSHPDMKIPDDGKIYSINDGNYTIFDEGIRNYIEYCQRIDGASKPTSSARYIGSLVADFHRNLLKGGIFMYPATKSGPNGKLRLLYECNPLSFVIEQAGGKATNGKIRIMEIVPEELHQRVPYFIGSIKMVEKVMTLIEQSAKV